MEAARAPERESRWSAIVLVAEAEKSTLAKRMQCSLGAADLTTKCCNCCTFAASAHIIAVSVISKDTAPAIWCLALHRWEPCTTDLALVVSLPLIF